MSTATLEKSPTKEQPTVPPKPVGDWQPARCVLATSKPIAMGEVTSVVTEPGLLLLALRCAQNDNPLVLKANSDQRYAGLKDLIRHATIAMIEPQAQRWAKSQLDLRNHSHVPRLSEATWREAEARQARIRADPSASSEMLASAEESVRTAKHEFEQATRTHGQLIAEESAAAKAMDAGVGEAARAAAEGHHARQLARRTELVRGIAARSAPLLDELLALMHEMHEDRSRAASEVAAEMLALAQKGG